MRRTLGVDRCCLPALKRRGIVPLEFALTEVSGGILSASLLTGVGGKYGWTQEARKREIMRCWNCGLPDVGERCPRCGAPQERRGPGMPPPAPPAPPGEARPPSGFIVNGAPIDMRPDGPVSGPLPPRTVSSPFPPRPGSTSGPLPPRPGPASGPLPPRPGPTSGPLPPRPGSTSGPLSARLAQSGPMPVQPGRSSGPLPGGSNQQMRGPSGPMGWDESGIPPENRRGAPPNWATGRPGAHPPPTGAGDAKLAG